MKYVFFINPVAGQGKKSKALEEEVRTVMERLNLPYEIVITQKAREMTEFVEKYASELNGEEARFFACGGDGTANEVINGIYGFSNISVGIFRKPGILTISRRRLRVIQNPWT